MNATDDDGSIQSWKLDVNTDGSAEFSGEGAPPTSQTYTYQDPGTYVATLFVIDNDGKWSMSSVRVSASAFISEIAAPSNDSA